MARVVRIHQHGGPEVLRIEEVEVPPPAPGEVRIRLRALGLNRADALLRAGTYIEPPALPSGLGLEAAGIVDAVGAGVDGFAPGDAVSVVPPVSMVRWPAYGELVTFPAALVVRHPPSLSWEAAAALWMPYLTAYGALIDIARLRKGEFVVVTAASSSVGLAAIQIANLAGAVPIAVTRTDTKRRPCWRTARRTWWHRRRKTWPCGYRRSPGRKGSGWCWTRSAARSSNRWRRRCPAAASCSNMAA